MTMEFARNAHQHARIALDLDLINAFNASKDSINQKKANIVLNAQVAVLFVMKKVFALNAVNTTIKDQMEIASDVMNHVENVKETQTIALLAELAITSMENNAAHAIQTARNALEQETYVLNATMVNS